MRKDARAQGDLLIQITLRETVLAKFEFRRSDVCEVRVKDSQRIEVCYMVSSNLIGTS